jgi:DNA topoisomerase-1
MSWDMHSNEICPSCGKFLLKKYSGKKIQYKCSNEECDFTKVEERKKEEE